jgi:hypothetical protein
MDTKLLSIYAKDWIELHLEFLSEEINKETVSELMYSAFLEGSIYILNNKKEKKDV